MNNLAAFYRDQGKYDEALGLYSEALKVAKQSFGDNHPGVAAIHTGQGVVYRHLGRYKEAREQHNTALKIILTSSGAHAPGYSQILSDIGLLESAEGNLLAAEETLSNVIEVRRKVFSQKHPFVADAMIEYAEVLRKQKKFDESDKVKKQAETIRKNIKETFKELD